MGELASALLAFPTVIYSAVLALLLAYWLLVIAGAVDLDDGGHEAILDAAVAKGDAASGMLDAAAGKGEALGHALHGKAALEHAPGEPSGFDDAGMAAGAFSLRRAPLTVTLSFLALFGWIVSFCAMHYLGQFGRAVLPEWLFGGVVFAGSLALAVPLASLATRPLEGIFKTNEGRRRGDLVGSVCRIRTGRVDDGFGQATLEDDGAELVIHVRIQTADGGTPTVFARGDSALIIDYDEERGAYVVEPYEDVLGTRERGGRASTREDS